MTLQIARRLKARLERLGARVVLTNARPDGTNINAGCGALHPGKVARAVRRGWVTRCETPARPAEARAMGFGEAPAVELTDRDKIQGSDEQTKPTGKGQCP